MEKSKLKSLLLRNLSILGTFGILNKSEDGGGGGGPKEGDVRLAEKNYYCLFC